MSGDAPEIRRHLRIRQNLLFSAGKTSDGYNQQFHGCHFSFCSASSRARMPPRRSPRCPYDVVNTDEARALARRESAELSARLARRDRSAAGTDPYADEVYERAAENFSDLRSRAPLVEEDVAGVLRVSPAHGRAYADRALPRASRSTSTTTISSRSTRRRGRTRKTIGRGTCSRISAQTGPVFLTYAASRDDRRRS